MPNVKGYDLNCNATIQSLAARSGPYWQTLEYCRHIGVHKKSATQLFWTARIRKTNGQYKQARLGEHWSTSSEGLTFDGAVLAAKVWFASPEISEIASTSYRIGSKTKLDYQWNSDHYTVGNALTEFIDWKRIAATTATFQVLVSLVNFHIVPRLAHIPVRDLKQQQVTQFCKQVLETTPKRGRQLSQHISLNSLSGDQLRKRKKTLNTLLTILRSSLRIAWENGSCDERVWRSIKRVPSTDVPRQMFLTRNECRRLLEECPDELADLVRAALYTGCRISELSEIRGEDVGRDVFGIYIRPGKSGRARYVYLNNHGMRFFLKKKSERPEGKYLFTTFSGRKWAGQHKHLFKSAVIKAGLPKEFVFHGLRHTYASQLVQAGAPLTVVARQLGHQTIATVSSTYGHLSAPIIEDVLNDRFENFEDQTGDHEPELSSIRNSLLGEEKVRVSAHWPRHNYSECSVPVLAQRSYQNYGSN